MGQIVLFLFILLIAGTFAAMAWEFRVTSGSDGEPLAIAAITAAIMAAMAEVTAGAAEVVGRSIGRSQDVDKPATRQSQSPASSGGGTNRIFDPWGTLGEEGLALKRDD